MEKYEETIPSHVAKKQPRYGRFINQRICKQLDVKYVYEIAVQICKNGKRYPVCILKAQDGATRLSLSTLFRSHRIRHRLNDVVNKGAKVYIRRCDVAKEFEWKQLDKFGVTTETLHGTDAVVKFMTHNFDYSWNNKKRSFVRRGLKL